VTKRARIAPGARFERLHRDAASRYGSDAPPLDDASEGGELDERERAMLVKAGDVVAMSSLIWHRSNANISDQTRMAFMPQFTSMPIMMRDGAMLGIDCSCDNAGAGQTTEQLLDARE
jgi:ectoine hydroxylase-related dioxygenase (phytanoyl-CoA dioxygenase family)